MTMTDGDRTVVAICGKGGVGKTTTCALLARLLTTTPRHREGKVLLVDGDPAGGLGMALGARPSRSLDDLRTEIIAELKEGSGQDPVDLAAKMMDWQRIRYGNGSRTCADPYGYIDGGGDEIGAAYQTCCTAMPWKYTALAARLLQAEGAVAEFRKVPFAMLLYGGDDVSGEEWDHRGWHKRKDTREALLWLAVEACLLL